MRSRNRTPGHRADQQNRAQIEARLRRRFEDDFTSPEGDLEINLKALCHRVTQSPNPITRRLTLSAALYLVWEWLRDQQLGNAVEPFVENAATSADINVRAFAKGVAYVIAFQMPVTDIEGLYWDALCR